MIPRPGARPILLEEFHVRVSAPRVLPPAEYDALRRALERLHLHARLGRAEILASP
jgi:hypothetical protein